MKKRMIQKMALGIVLAAICVQMLLGAVPVWAAGGYGAQAVVPAPDSLDYAYLCEVTEWTQAQVEGVVKLLSDQLAGSSQTDVSALGITITDDSIFKANVWLLLAAAGTLRPYEYNAVKWQFRYTFFLSEDESHKTICDIILETAETYTAAQISARAEELKTAVGEIFQEMPRGMGKVDLAVWAHDYIVKNYAYDYANYEAGNVPAKAHTAYGMLIDGVGVCDAYTGAYNMILQLCGIEAIEVSGTGNGGSHAWSQIKLDGQWYAVDVTWDDPVMMDENGASSDVKGRSIYRYLFLTDEEMRRDHTWLNGRTCTSTRFSNWFARERDNMNYYKGFWYYMDNDGDFVRSDIGGNNPEVVKEKTLVEAATMYNGRIFYIKDFELWVENADGTDSKRLAVDYNGVEMTTPWYNYVAKARWLNAIRDNVMMCQFQDYHVVTPNESGGSYLSPKTVNKSYTLLDIYARPYESTLRMAGDVNGNGHVESGDVVSLMQYLAEMNVEIVTANSDVNGNGHVDSGDVVLLMQYLAEMNVQLQ